MPKRLFLAIAVLSVGVQAAWANHPVKVFDAEQVRMGRSVYREYCAECHGANMQGPANPKDFEKKIPPRLDSKGHASHHGDHHFFSQILDGSRDRTGALVDGGMPPFREVLKDDQVWAVITYIKSRWTAEFRRRQNRHNPGHHGAMGRGRMHDDVMPNAHRR